MKHKLCSASKSDGTPCRHFAHARLPHCHYHHDLELRARRRLRALRPHTIRLGSLPDRPSILRALNRVIQAIAAGFLPPKQADALLHRIHLASVSLPPMTAAAAQSCCRNRKV
jgi:hypothetical protein